MMSTHHAGELCPNFKSIQDASNLPQSIASDEKHTKQLGEKTYACITSTKDCLLGASLSERADEQHLKLAYGEFARDCKEVKADYSPQTNNRDGWEAGILAFVCASNGYPFQYQ